MRKLKLGATERFEIIGMLYHRDTGKLRPGKSVPLELGYDSCDNENQERFDQWFATRAFSSALEYIAALEKAIAEEPL